MVLKTLAPDPNLHWLVEEELMLRDVAYSTSSTERSMLNIEFTTGKAMNKKA